MKNETFLLCEKEESQNLVELYFSLQLQTMNQFNSHSTTRESKSVGKGRTLHIVTT